MRLLAWSEDVHGIRQIRGGLSGLETKGNAPELNLIFFKHLADSVLFSYFRESDFTREDGGYALVETKRESTVKAILDGLIVQKLKDLVEPWDIMKPKHYLVIGSCFPKDNLILDFLNGIYLPESLLPFVSKESHIKYIFREKDLLADTVLFNKMLTDIFNRYFDGKNLERSLGKGYSNVHFIQHRRLDCYLMFKTIKYIYGKTNCRNMFLEKGIKNNRVILAVNEMVDKVIDKRVLNGSIQMKIIAKEVRQYLDFCLGLKRV